MRYYDFTHQRVVYQLYDFTEDKFNAPDLCNYVRETFLEDKIPLSNLVSIMCDSCNLMRGYNEGLTMQMKRFPGCEFLIDLGGCSVHHLHNAASYAAEAMPSFCDVAELCDDLYAYFRITECRHQFEELASEMDEHSFAFIRRIDTRWF